MRFPRFPLPMSVARGVTNARNRVFDLGDAVIPGGVALFDLVFGLQRTKIAGVLVSSGLADALGRDSRDPVELAQELGLDPDVTTRVIEAAVASRLMRLDRQGRARLRHVGAPPIPSLLGWHITRTPTLRRHTHTSTPSCATALKPPDIKGRLASRCGSTSMLSQRWEPALRMRCVSSPSSVSPTWCGPIRGRGVESSAMLQVGSGTCLRPSLNTGPTLAASFSIHPRYRAGRKISARARVGRPDRTPHRRPVR